MMDAIADALAGTGDQVTYDKPYTWLVTIYPLYSILKYFQVDNAGMLRMTSSARYFKEGVGARCPN